MGSLGDVKEYLSPVKLSGISGNRFAVPHSIITDSDMNDKRVTAFSFFSVRRGLDCCLTFSLNNIVKWTGRKPNRHENGINDKFAQAVEYLEDQGYLTLSGKPGHTSCVDACLSLDRIAEECECDRFAVIYLDELRKILDYKNPNSKDVFLNSDVVLLVFAYLRMMIFRRRNRLLPEEIGVGGIYNRELDIETRRKKSPDTYNGYYCDMADELGITSRTFSKAVDALNDMGLIYSESLPRVKHDGKWKTTHTVFCNAYKREGDCLLASGEEYYLAEVENKKNKLNI